MSSLTLKKMVSTPASMLGHFLIEFATPGIDHILKSTCCEFIVLDRMYSGYSYETAGGAHNTSVQQICR